MFDCSAVTKARYEVDVVHCVAGKLERDCGRQVVRQAGDCVFQSNDERVRGATAAPCELVQALGLGAV
jgi:hypothetical protein